MLAGLPKIPLGTNSRVARQTPQPKVGMLMCSKNQVHRR